MTDYAYEQDIEVRLRDVDFMGIVNNAVYATYLEEIRESFFREVVGESLVDLDTVLANLEIQYKRQIETGADISIGLRVADLGDSSITLEYEIRADGQTAATARSVQVFVDRESNESRSIPPAVRTPLEEASG